MPKRGPNRRKRVPKLSFTENQGIGRHVSFRDPMTGLPRKHRFQIAERTGEEKARALYHAWVAKYLGVVTELPIQQKIPQASKGQGMTQEVHNAGDRTDADQKIGKLLSLAA